MRILHLLASPYWTGPAENVALLAAAQRSLGHQVSVAIDRLRTRITSEELAAPRFSALGLLDDGGLELCVKSTPLGVWRDVRALKTRPLDVIHSHFSHDHLVARWGRPEGALLVRSIHAPRSLRRLMPHADALTVPSRQELRRLVGRKVLVLPPLVDPAFAPPAERALVRKELGIEGDPVIGMVSTFQATRRHDVGVDAFARLHARLPQSRLVLVGDGDTLPQVRAQVASLGLTQSVTFAGYQQGEAFVRWLQALDTVWILGLGNDWSGRAALQARACGVRVVAIDLGQLAEHADEIVALDPDALVAATLAGDRIDRPLRSNADVAQDVLRLYGA